VVVASLRRPLAFQGPETVSSYATLATSSLCMLLGHVASVQLL
jgi:hypothetical protein